MRYIVDSEQSGVRHNMDADSDKSLQEELQRFTTGQNGVSESDTGPAHKVCSMFFKFLLVVTSGVMRGGVVGFTPPKFRRAPQTRVKLNLIVKTVKNC